MFLAQQAKAAKLASAAETRRGYASRYPSNNFQKGLGQEPCWVPGLQLSRLGLVQAVKIKDGHAISNGKKPRRQAEPAV